MPRISGLRLPDPRPRANETVNQHLYQFLYGPGSINHKLLLLVNHDTANRFFDLLMPLLTYMGGSRLVYLYALIMIVWAAVDRKRMPWRYPAVFILGTFLGLIMEEGLKHLLQVPRPVAALGLGNVRVLGELKLKNSLPSGHVVFSTMMAYTLGYGRGLAWKLPLWSFAAGVAFSRVYMGAHYPLDILVGGVVGVLAGFTAWQAGEALGRASGGRK
jgi:undecaprenyl-diphosphatase